MSPFRNYFVLACLLANGCLCLAQTAEQPLPPDVKLEHFAQLDKFVYVGSKPTTDQDFEFLKSKHIKTILNAKFLPFLTGPEKRKAKRYGMQFRSVPMNASPIPPMERHVNQILEELRDPGLQPIYLHCVLGRDRTSLISGLYKIYFLGLSKNAAWREMRQSGFKTWWILRGLKVYFDGHATSRPAALKASAQRGGVAGENAYAMN